MTDMLTAAVALSWIRISTDAMHEMNDVPVAVQTLGALAFAGDVSMGQPVDHSPRTALLADRIAQVLGLDTRQRAAVIQLALLRWSGCTANASEFADLFGDDITGRAALLSNGNPFVSRPVPTHPIGALIQPLAQAHCEVAGELARRLGLADAVLRSVRDVFEWWDGTGLPSGLRGEAIAIEAQLVSLAGDVEALVRAHGLARGIGVVEQHAGHKYDPTLVRIVRQHAAGWLQAIESVASWAACCELLDPAACTTAPLTPDAAAALLGDYADLKTPFSAGASRRVADGVARGAHALAVGANGEPALRRAALTHALGRVSVSNAIFDKPRALTDADWERVRLVPHWTQRILQRIPALAASQMLAASVFERADGSGYHRGIDRRAQPPGAPVLQAALVWDALTSQRPWRAAFTTDRAHAELQALVVAGRLDAAAVGSLFSATERSQSAASQATLTPREVQVLSLLARGHSNKETARALSISPSTVGTHAEHIFRKLGVTTRAAATLKAASAGLLIQPPR
jgi:HD-GYP domain-containing protein (c-di-GMP phosphodiesterase class II)